MDYDVALRLDKIETQKYSGVSRGFLGIPLPAQHVVLERL